MHQAMKTRTALFTIWLSIVTGGVKLSAGEEARSAGPPVQNAPENTQDVGKVIPVPNGEIAKLSSGLQDIVRLVRSGASNEVVLSFIENSPIAYFPGAEDVIRLHELGVPAPVIIAILRHGSQVREQQLQAAQTNHLPALSTAEWYWNSSSQTTNQNGFVNSAFPVVTFSYPIWWFAGSPGFWWGYLWPYYNCGFWPRNSWCYVPPRNNSYPRGSWGAYSRKVAEPRASFTPTPRPIPSYVARPAAPPMAVPRPNYSAAPASRGTVVSPGPVAPRGRGR